MSIRISKRAAVFGLTGLATCALLPTSEARAAALPARLERLLREFRSCPGLEADFEEEKNIVLLAAPLKSSGKVYFHPPHALARIVSKPRVSHLVINGKKIIVREEGVRREVDLSDKPALRGLVSSLLHVLSGDQKKLVQDFDTHFVEEGAQAWRLQLVPKDPELRRLVDSLSFSGVDLKLRELRVKEANGDETITKFSNVNEKRRFSKAEIKKIFEI